MSDLDTLFYELIRVSIGTQTALSRLPSETEWEELFEMAVKQSLVGVCFTGLHDLGAGSDGPSIGSGQEETFARIGMSEEQFFEWMGMAVQINMRNDVVNEQCVTLQKRLADDRIRSSILKGQGVAMLYGEELRGFRQSGDIDIYVDCGREKAIEYARSIQGDVDWDYKHLHLKVFKAPSAGLNTEVEMHYVPEVFLNLRKNRKLQKWFKEPDVQSSLFQVSSNMVCPSVVFNLFYILLHTYRHFLYEGVGMRQLMDYYFVLRASSIVPSSKIQEVTKTIDFFDMKKFASGVMWIMKEVFGMSEQQLLVDPDEKEGRYILSEVMTGGNFGHHDERLAIGVKGKFGAVMKILRHSIDIGIHYPVDMIWAPINIVHHWCWKRYHIYFNSKRFSK